MVTRSQKFSDYFPCWHPLKGDPELIKNEAVRRIAKAAKKTILPKNPTEKKLLAAMEFFEWLQTYAMLYEDARDRPDIPGKLPPLRSQTQYTKGAENAASHMIGAVAGSSNTRGLWEFLEYFGMCVPSGNGIDDWKEHEFIAVYLLHLMNELLQTDDIERVQDISMEIADSYLVMRFYRDTINDSTARISLRGALARKQKEGADKKNEPYKDLREFIKTEFRDFIKSKHNTGASKAKMFPIAWEIFWNNGFDEKQREIFNPYKKKRAEWVKANPHERITKEKLKRYIKPKRHKFRPVKTIAKWISEDFHLDVC